MEEKLAAPAMSSPVAARLWEGQRGGSSDSGTSALNRQELPCSAREGMGLARPIPKRSPRGETQCAVEFVAKNTQNGVFTCIDRTSDYFASSYVLRSRYNKRQQHSSLISSGFVALWSPRTSDEFARFSPPPLCLPPVHSPHNITSSAVLSANQTTPCQRTTTDEPIRRGHVDKA
ncbi:hypothetical protein Scep_024171 [Stephania cephalantha]|uniref:Uncharacterized protein n=1 Tax=Stephania cephalantha TaxID=152367 RepID=A0AAP0HY08_9MAGN